MAMAVSTWPADSSRADVDDISLVASTPTCPQTAGMGIDPAPALKRDPEVREIRPRLDFRDEAAALEAVQVALTEVGDGATYVWHRPGGRISGLVQPTVSFLDPLGRVCRTIVVTLNDAARSSRVEGTACRLADGAWQLDG
jgi:surface antigen